MNDNVLNKVLHGDCLELSSEIESESVDLILTDLPYGNMKNAPSTWDKEKTKWDITIEPSKVFKIANRILRKNGKMVLFSQEPYTTRLISESTSNLPFSYRAIWEKDTFANALGVNKSMVSFFEDILVFSKLSPKPDDKRNHPLKSIMLKYVEKYGKDYIIELFFKEGRYTSEQSARVHASYKFGFNNGLRFDLMNLSLYEYLSKYINFEESFQELKDIDVKFNKDREKEREEFLKRQNELFPYTFNLWEGKKYKSNILKYKKDYSGFHPTQKPILLLEDLIKTFSNEGNTVVDLTAGSCSTAVASLNTNRNFICIEQDWDYCMVGNERIKEARLQSQIKE